MSGETNLGTLIRSMRPKLHPGQYVFCHIGNTASIPMDDLLFFFKEEEAVTIVIKRELADHYQLPYDYAAAWITLTIQSSLSAVGLTAAFSAVLAGKNISCNVVAAYHHDHIFVDAAYGQTAVDALLNFSESYGQ